MRNRFIALIPAYEPDVKILGLTDELREKGFDIVVVDDGSGPEYEQIFGELAEGATVLTHAANLGKGAALRTGLEYINKYMAYSETVLTVSGAVSVSGRDAVIVTVDADGQHLPDDVLRVAEIAASRPDALVLGSRDLDEDVPARSRLGNTVTRHVYSAVTGVHVHDTQTGLRAFHRSMIPRLLEIEGDRYEYEINMLMLLAADGVPIIEERIETVYEDNNSCSHFRTLRDSLRVYKEILKFSASSLASFVIDYCMYALLLAVTGELPMESIRQAAEEIPLMVCPNVSQGAEALRQLTEHAHALLGEEYDRTVIELHHREKKDAPSGTAKVLLEALDAGNERAVSIRAGQYPGMHRVLFSGPWDSLEIIHTVFDRKLFAHSAVRAACFLSRCAPGLYDIRDALLSPFCES